MTTYLFPKKDVSRLYKTFFIVVFLLSTTGLFAQTTHYLIVGSHAQLGPAKKHQARMVQKGYEDTQVLYPTPDTRNYRISIRSANERNILDGYARSLPNNLPHWILKLNAPAESFYYPSTDPTYRSGNPEIQEEAKTETTSHLIIHSAESYKEADGIRNAYSGEYPDAQVLPRAKNGYYRVSIYESDNERRLQQIARARGIQGKKEGWILSITKEIQPKPTINKRIQGDYTYYLIYGAYKNYDVAVQKLNDIRNMGYEDATVLPMTEKSKYYRLSVFQSQNPYQVEDFQSQFFSSEAWILKM